MRTLVTAGFAAMLLPTTFAQAGETPSPPDARVYFINLDDGATVESPVFIQMGLSGMGIAPVGTDVENTGHHHLLINHAPFGEGPEDDDMNENGIYADENHRHFGGGQTEASIELPPGTHTLQLLLGDLAHIPHDPIVMSEQITITVDE